MKKFIIAVCAVLVVGGIAYAGLKLNSVPTNQEQIKIGIVVYPGYGAFYIAQEKGFFDKEGVKVELVKLSAENLIPSLGSNQVQMIAGSADFTLIAADSGIDVVQIFAPSLSYGADGMVTRHDVKDITELKGKKVYLGLGFPSHFFFRYLAAQKGLKPSDVEIVNMDPEQVGVSFVAGNINAGMTWEPWLTKILTETKNGRILFSSRDYPNIISDDVIVRRDVLEKRREDIKKVMRGYFKAVDYWEKNRTEGNAIVARNFGLTPGEFAPIRDTVTLADYAFNLKKFDKTQAHNMYEIMTKAAEIYYQDGVIKTKPDINKIIDPSLLNEIR